MGGLQAKSMTSQRNRAVKDGGYVLLWQRYDNNKMADVLPWQRYDDNKMVAMRYHGNDDVILHLQQYSHRLNLFFLFFKCYAVPKFCCCPLSSRHISVINVFLC